MSASVVRNVCAVQHTIKVVVVLENHSTLGGAVISELLMATAHVIGDKHPHEVSESDYYTRNEEWHHEFEIPWLMVWL
jgi:hypothetical protein